jgi:hypothetical protein
MKSRTSSAILKIIGPLLFIFGVIIGSVLFAFKLMRMVWISIFKKNENIATQLEDEMINLIQKTIEKKVQGECFVKYFAYEKNSKGHPVDNLDKVAIEGKVQFVFDISYAWNVKPYKSGIVENPTWNKKGRTYHGVIMNTT